jgi:hypothetical protein
VRRIVLLLFVAALMTSCSLFGPSPRNISRWLTPPEPGSTYTYAITTTWHDGSESIEERNYVVERVEKRDDNTTAVKFADEEHLTSFFWIVSPEGDAIFESVDAVIDDADLLILLAPVEEGAEWSSGPASNEIDYEIDRINAKETTAIGELKDLVEVVCSYDENPTVDITLEWTPDAGLMRYEEDHGSSSSYIDTYERELTAVTVPE